MEQSPGASSVTKSRVTCLPSVPWCDLLAYTSLRLVVTTASFLARMLPESGMATQVDLVLQLRALPLPAVQCIAQGLVAVPGCLVSRIPHDGPDIFLRASVQQRSKYGGTPSEAALEAVQQLEQQAQVPSDLVDKVPELASLLGDVANSSSSSSILPSGKKLDHQQDEAPYGSDVQHSVTSYGRSAAALSPAGPQATPASTGTVSPAAVSTQEGAGGTQQLLPLLQRCGILLSVFPENDPAAIQHLRSKVWGSWLAPVTGYRQYFGDQVGFYLAYLNALTCWLLAPAAAGSFLLWALGAAADNRTGLSSPIIPIIVVFQLLWSAAGVKLWRRHQALLKRQWSISNKNLQSTPPLSSTSTSGRTFGHQTVNAGTGYQAGGGGGAVLRQPSLSQSHFRGGVPEWAAQAPTATGTRWQFVGSWKRTASGQWQLQAPMVPQLLRVIASVAATAVMLLGGAVVLLVALNLQGLIAPSHSLLYIPRLAALSSPGGALAEGLAGQVPMVMRVLAVSLYDMFIFGPVAQVLTSFENRRTLEGFDASLTAKKAALLFLFTFAPVLYVGLAGAGAAAAANDAAGYFKYELLRRVVMEFVMPWVTLSLSARRHKAQKRKAMQSTGQATSAAAPGTVPSKGSTAVVPVGATEGETAVLKPSFDSFTGIWDVTRDMGYVMLFAAILPWAAPLTLLYTLAKIKQDCVSLLMVYRRPLPRHVKNLGSWNTVLLVQVVLAVLTNVFLSGLSSGQLAQLLPSPLVPASLSASLTAAAAARPTDSTTTAQVGQATGGGLIGPFRTLEAISTGSWQAGWQSGDPGLYASGLCPNTCPVPRLFGSGGFGGVCPAGHTTMQPPKLHTAAWGQQARQQFGALGGGIGHTDAAATHMLLLFALEHVMLLLVVLVLVLVPDEPAGSTGSSTLQSRPFPASSANLTPQPQQQQHTAGADGPQSNVRVKLAAVESQPRVLSGGEQGAAAAQPAAPVSVHGNPLFTVSTARKSEGA